MGDNPSIDGERPGHRTQDHTGCQREDRRGPPKRALNPARNRGHTGIRIAIATGRDRIRVLHNMAPMLEYRDNPGLDK